MLRGGFLAVLFLAAAAVGLAACGGGESGNDFASEANAICKRAAEESLAIYRSPLTAEGTQKAAIGLQQRYLELDEKVNRQLKAIEPPTEETKPYAAFLDAAETVKAHQEKVVQAAKDGKPQLYNKLNEAVNGESEELHEKAGAVAGLETCAEELPDAEAEEIVHLIEKNEMVADPAQCTDYFAQNIVEQQWKTKKGCEEFQENESAKDLPDSVDAKVTEGVTGVKATAEVSFHGGKLDGQTIEYGLAREGGRWMVVFGAPKQE